MGISGEDIEKIEITKSSAIRKIITIENLTTFFRWQENNNLIIYLGGYHNKTRRNLLNKIYELIDKQYIYEKEEKILSCNCKKVEIAETNLSTINMVDANFIKRDNEYYCKYCHQPCQIKTNKVIVFNPNLIKDKQYNFYPDFITC